MTEEQNNVIEKKDNEPETEEKKEETEVKKGFWSTLGKGAKIGICTVGAALLAGGIWLATAVFGGDKDEDKPKVIESGETEE